MNQLIEQLKKEFDEMFPPAKNLSNQEGEYSAIPLPFIKSFIFQECIPKVLEKLLGEICKKKLDAEKIKNDLDFIEQITIYNQALSDIEQLIKSNLNK